MTKNRSVLRAGVVGLCLLSLASCSNMNDTEQRVVSGGAIGATVGVVGTVVTGGCIACGAAIGGAVGAAGGYVVDQIDKSNKAQPNNAPVTKGNETTY